MQLRHVLRCSILRLKFFHGNLPEKEMISEIDAHVSFIVASGGILSFSFYTLVSPAMRQALQEVYRQE